MSWKQVKTDETRLINWLTRLLNPLIRSSTSKVLAYQLKLLTASLIETVSRTEIEVPGSDDGVIYRTEFTGSPAISERGMMLDMALYHFNPINSVLEPVAANNATVSRVGEKRGMDDSERSRSLSFTNFRPTRFTSIQPFVTPAFLTQLNPIILSSVTTSLASLDLTTTTMFQTVKNPMHRNSGLDINMTRLRVYDVEWEQGSGIQFGEGVVKLSASLSSKVDVSYFTNSRYVICVSLLLELRSYSNA
jgi:hypothetical protein